MRMVALSEVTESIEYGVTASANRRPVGPKFLRITDIQDGAVNWSSVPFCDANERKLASCLLKPGDIVFARTGATTGKSFLIRSCPQHAVFASYLIRVRPNRHINPVFLVHYFDSPGYWGQISLKSAGAAQPGVNSSKLKELQIPLPPRAEQDRIAMILDQVDDLRRKRKAVLRLLERLRLAIFHDLFGDPGALSGRWPLVTIGDLLSSAQYGTSAKAESDGTLPILRMNNITYDGNLDLSDLKFLDLPEREMDKYTVSDGDILFNRTNSPELVGKTAVVKNAGPMAFAGYLVRLRTNEKANSEYISAFLNSPFGKKVLRGMAKSIIGMANINAREVQTIRITCPPINLQRKFATLLAELDSLKSVQTAHLTKLSALFASLRHRAFNGELSVKAAERELAEAG